MKARGAAGGAILWESPISYPEKTIGRFSIKHRYFKPGLAALVSDREAFLTGRRPVSLVLNAPMKIHELVERCDGHEAVWMSDEPQELRQIAEWLTTVRPKGRVLVGGLGLGVVATWLAGIGCTVDVVERQREVIDLLGPDRPYKTYHADIYQFLEGVDQWPWNYAFLDIWQGTSESTWWDEVMPLRRIIAGRFGKRHVHCWAENIMIGQVQRALAYGNRSWHYTGFPHPMRSADITRFTSTVGLPYWERRWGHIVPYKKKETGDGQPRSRRTEGDAGAAQGRTTAAPVLHASGRNATASVQRHTGDTESAG